MTTYKLLLEYDGTTYAGWQRQPDRPTIQAALEHALRQITQCPVSTIAASRTDAGVHALGQVVGFRSDRALLPHEWTRSLNGVLPKSISVRQTEIAADDFHARYDARSKTYEYHILNQPARPALDRLRVWHVARPLDVNLMREAARDVLGQHDCTSFQGPNAGTNNPVCTIRRIDWVHDGPSIRFTIQADRFLKQMVRALVGTLVEIGHGKRSPEAMGTILEARDRRAAGPTAPPHGLYLLRVHYETEEPQAPPHPNPLPQRREGEIVRDDMT